MDIVHVAERYRRRLGILRHGHALWIPEPNHALPSQCRDAGLSIGDVGRFTPSGGFESIFNVCEPANHLLNQFTGVPPDFELLHWDCHQIYETPNYFRPGIPVCSSGAKQWEIGVEGSIAIPGLPLGAGAGIAVSFSRESGAVLMPPNGATRTDCLERGKFREYLQKNGVSLYKLVNGTLQREMGNGSLYLVTGVDKTNAWENVVVDHGSRSQSCSLMFNTGGVVDGRLRLARSSLQQASVTSRCSPEENTKHNQTLFVRGFCVSVKTGFWSKFGRRVSVSGTDDMSYNDPLGKSRHVPFGNWSTGSSSSRSRRSSQSSTDDSLSNIEDNMADEVHHPLMALSNALLQLREDAEIVVIHDDDLISLLTEEDIEIPDTSILMQRLLSTFEVEVEAGHIILRKQPPWNQPDDSNHRAHQSF
ncbi:SCF ubiquitin ligase complex subunit cdc4 [Paramarasmius palmivorus]|uniref:SCF ubiquitin ligase complex subunit cdc4 n=1 Tax=Paramarasmius palmivorus TaxID=297713 RepID=A0AAW0CNF2_9AGAR